MESTDLPKESTNEPRISSTQPSTSFNPDVIQVMHKLSPFRDAAKNDFLLGREKVKMWNSNIITNKSFVFWSLFNKRNLKKIIIGTAAFTNNSPWQCYLYYPHYIKVQILVEDILDHTIQRLAHVQQDGLLIHHDHTKNSPIEVIFKWGLDRSGRHCIYKQCLTNNSLYGDTNIILCTCVSYVCLHNPLTNVRGHK